MSDLKIGFNITLTNDGELTLDVSGLDVWSSVTHLGHLQSALWDFAGVVGQARYAQMTDEEKEAEIAAIRSRVGGDE